VTPSPAEIAAAFTAACLDELDAPKPGNVHHYASGHRMTADDFVRSAAAAARPLAQHGARVGARILAAVEATSAAVGANTNLGIILLAAPLAAAAERDGTDLRAALTGVLATLDVEDASLAFRAIVGAAPGGLGRAERHDVFAPATVTLRQAMAEAADRDRIARQYASDFDDVFTQGNPALTQALAHAWPLRWATVAVYLAFLAAFPDSHILRKHGAAVAEDTRRKAEGFRARLHASERPEQLLADLLAWDSALKRENINPGTSADLTVATLFAHRLNEHLPPRTISD
jgi:triphosphoribosyl-dephospho-CoA synthase